MNNNKNNVKIDLFLVSSMIGRAVEDLVYRQMEECERDGRLTEVGKKALAEMRGAVDFEGNPKEPMTYARIDSDITILAELKEQIDKELGILT